MKILHTADLHLGCSLGAEKRFDEFDSLLKHLCSVIEQEKIEAIIIAGDVFDNHLPPNRAAEQYYNFLIQAGRAGARSIIVTGGNHDSATYLEAPKEVLKHLSVHVFANTSRTCSDMIVKLEEKNGKLAALVGAVPYLHERDLVTVEGGQGALDRETALRNAMLEYYRKMADALKAVDSSVPHIMTGHLFVTDKNEKNDSWIGTLMSVATSDFPDSIDYLALGHLHDAHTLKSPHKTLIRYPGAPVNVSFRELGAAKTVTVIDTDNIQNIREIPLPSFQDMRILSGTKAELESELLKLSKEEHSIWCSVENTGDYEPGLTENLNELIKGSQVRILTCRNKASNPAVLRRLPEEHRLADLAPAEVFKMMLNEYEISGPAADQLLEVFREIETAARESE